MEFLFSISERSDRRYKIIDCVRERLKADGPLNRDSAAYICQQLHIEQDVVYGQTKLFMKKPFVAISRNRVRSMFDL